MLGMIFYALAGFSQNRYFTKNGQITFAAGTALEDIDGTNKSTSSVYDVNTGQIEFAVLIKGFEFKRALMQEHFNENYLESDKYPRAVFRGKVIDAGQFNFKKDGSYPVTVKGTLEMHGVKKEITVPAAIKVAGTAVNASAAFEILLSDFNITIPGLVKDKISKSVNVRIECNYSELK